MLRFLGGLFAVPLQQEKTTLMYCTAVWKSLPMLYLFHFGLFDKPLSQSLLVGLLHTSIGCLDFDKVQCSV